MSKETIKLLGRTKKVIAKDENGENVPKLEIIDVILIMHCNIVKNNYEHASKVLLTFVPDKQFGQLITITPHSLTMLKTTNSEFQFIEVWFTNQDNRPYIIKDIVNKAPIIGTG